MFSVNAPVPGRVERLANDLHPTLSAFDTIREHHTLAVKRLGEGDPDHLDGAVRQAIAGAPAVEARIDGIGVFREPTAGPGPVVYLSVESPGLRDLHQRLVDAFGTVSGIEGDDYIPHVTLARGGPAAAVNRILASDVASVTWRVSELAIFDAHYGETVSRIRLPA